MISDQTKTKHIEQIIELGRNQYLQELFKGNPPEQFFTMMYSAHYEKVYYKCYKYLGDLSEPEQLTEDVTSEVWLRFWEDISSSPRKFNFRGDGVGENGVIAYLMKKAKFISLKQRRKKEFRSEKPTDPEKLAVIAGAEDDYNRDAEIAERRHNYQKVKGEVLSPGEEEVYDECMKGRSTQDIAYDRGVSENTVKKQKTNATKKLREKFKRDKK